MRFGLRQSKIFMKNKFVLLFATAALFAAGCKEKKTGGDITLSPESGTSFKTGQTIPVKVNYPSDMNPDSIVYLLDSARVGSKKDSTTLALKSDSLALGSRTITAKIYKGGTPQAVSINVNILPSKAPEEYTYQVVKKFPHDTSCYTEGLVYQDGHFYESAGNYGHSDVRKVDVNTGKPILKSAPLDKKYFGEGISIIDNKLVQLTYREKVGFVYDKNTLKQTSTFTNNVGVEGWGMCYDGKKLYMDDSTNRIWFLDKTDYHQTGFIDVYDDKGAVNEVNELEYIDGKLYSNVYTKDEIIVIDPKTGAVLQHVDMSNLWPLKDHPKGFDNDQNVLNGIAWDAQGKRLFVTGKKWPFVYQIKLVKK